MTTAVAPVRTSFSIPPELHATEPPEVSGRTRDDVRLLVARSGSLEHARFRDLPEHLRPGDLLVVNVSATIAAAVDGIEPGGAPVTVHFSAPRADDRWVVELRAPSGGRRGGAPGVTVTLPGGARADVLAAHGDAGRLWVARVTGAESVEDYLARYGRPIAYDYVGKRWPLSAYQTVFARIPGSVEMPSAARPFTDRLVTELVTRGIALAPVVLHCGVSSLEAGEAPEEERYEVPAATARLVNATRRGGGRVVAVGTTATRALETVARRDGTVRAGRGVTDLMLHETRPPRVVDGLVTGWHPPGASHLSLLEAVAGPVLVREAYQDALAHGYLWHEFGDSCLLLPGAAGRERATAVA
ncbi:MAG: S-adenosylmethionine:tRNA ribosyltransferase-isomerase [Actinomycetota bacterium]|nr:S-adenosylmethionine:tRNA ribosyltransferase-isomerase [Actinomycetota bacterium]